MPPLSLPTRFACHLHCQALCSSYNPNSTNPVPITILFSEGKLKLKKVHWSKGFRSNWPQRPWSFSTISGCLLSLTNFSTTDTLIQESPISQLIKLSLLLSRYLKRITPFSGSLLCSRAQITRVHLYIWGSYSPSLFWVSSQWDYKGPGQKKTWLMSSPTFPPIPRRILFQ